MGDDALLRSTVGTACPWTHTVPSAVRRCRLGRHLRGRWEARGRDAEKLTFFGLAYFERLPRHEC
jgi:hypothetical protein